MITDDLNESRDLLTLAYGEIGRLVANGLGEAERRQVDDDALGVARLRPGAHQLDAPLAPVVELAGALLLELATRLAQLALHEPGERDHARRPLVLAIEQIGRAALVAAPRGLNARRRYVRAVPALERLALWFCCCSNLQFLNP